MGGERGRFLYERTADGSVEAIDLQTGEVLETVEYKPGKYRFFVDGKPRYINEQTIENDQRRTRVEQLPDSIQNRRNNAVRAKKGVLDATFLCKYVGHAFVSALGAYGFPPTPKRRCRLGSYCPA